MDINHLTGEIIGAAIEVHKALGPGLLESAYEECLCHEFKLRSFPFERQKELPIEYKGVKLNCGYRMDIVIWEKDRGNRNQKSEVSLRPIGAYAPVGSGPGGKSGRWED